MGYSINAIKGISWTGLMRAIVRLLTFVRLAILARLLTPTQFGIFGITTIVLTFLEMLTETGINVVLVQDKDNKLDNYLDTAFIISIIRGFLIGLLIFILAPLISAFFKTPDVLPLLRLTALIPIIRGFINPAEVNFQKLLQFKQEFYFRSVIFFIDSLITVILTLITRSPIALVYGMLVGVLAEVILSHLFLKPTPAFSFHLPTFKIITKKGKWITFTGVLSYITSQSTDVVIGKLSTVSALGTYQNVYRIAMVPISEVIDLFNKVAFPIFIKISDDSERLKRALIRNYLAVLAIIIPFVVICLLFPTPIISLVLGEKWLTGAPIMQELAILGLLIALAAPINPLLLARHHQDYLSHVTLFRLIVTLATILPLTYKFGLVGAIHAQVISAFLVLPLRVFYTHKALHG